MELAHFIKTTQVENVCVYCPLLPPKTGTLCVSSHHLLLCPPIEENAKQEQSYFCLLHCAVDTVEKSVLNMGMFNSRGYRSDVSGKSGMGMITLKCKDLRVIHLDIPGMEETLNIAHSIQALASIGSISLSYPFFFRPPGCALVKGWPRDTTENFFQRIKAETDSWRISEVNEGFEACLSYPTKVIVPQFCSDDILMRAASFRRGGRFPILSYFHKNNRTVLLRCAQPLFGSDCHHCKEDEALLKEVLVGQTSGFIIDICSAKQAKHAQSARDWTEKQSRYPNWRILYRPVERGQDLQESLTRLVAACHEPSPGMSYWLSKLQACRWMFHVKETLSTAGLIAECIEREGACVLVQGETGTDNTLLMTSLAQLILSPECRTMDGFQDLIEREWLQAGHPFQLRCAGSGWSHGRTKQESPNFLLFLDCCWQLGRQFPRSLAFNEVLLCTLAHHAYSSEYGSFLCNNERERNLYEVKDRTLSLWGFLNEPKQRCKLQNPMYDENPLVIWPSVAPQSLQLWGGFFLRHLLPQEDTQLAGNRILELTGGVPLNKG